MDVKDNKERNRFETEIDGHQAFVEYSVKPDIIVLEHTKVDKALGGRGVGSELVEAVLLQIELRGLKVIPKCGFVRKYIDKHPEWESLVVKK